MNLSPWLRGLLAKIGRFAIAAFVICCPAVRQATGLTLTAAGMMQRPTLTLTTFATGFPNSSTVGPLGIGFPDGGGVLVSDFPGNVRLFPTDVDGRIRIWSAPVAQSYGLADAKDLAKIGASFFMTQGTAGKIVELNEDGTFNRTVISGINSPEGLAVNPSNSHLFVAAQGTNQILDVNPATGTSVVFHSVSSPDGISISPDGQTLYVAATGTGHLFGIQDEHRRDRFRLGHDRWRYRRHCRWIRTAVKLCVRQSKQWKRRRDQSDNACADGHCYRRIARGFRGGGSSQQYSTAHANR